MWTGSWQTAYQPSISAPINLALWRLNLPQVWQRLMHCIIGGHVNVSPPMRAKNSCNQPGIPRTKRLMFCKLQRIPAADAKDCCRWITNPWSLRNPGNLQVCNWSIDHKLVNEVPPMTGFLIVIQKLRDVREDHRKVVVNLPGLVFYFLRD